jgi:predicted patatin/cPLA2 family phospholipase
MGVSPVPPFRIVANTAVRLIASVAVISAVAWPVLHTPSFGADTAYAQSKKSPPKAKQLPKDQPRTAFTLEEQNAAVIPGIPDARVWGDSEADFQRVLPTVNGPWLALSGGGADGAYGAGLLTGWSQSGNRPEFAVVTGSSIGGLIAPYAFLGPRFDEELRKNFAEITAADVFEDRQTPESLFDSWPLKQTIEKRVTREMLAAIAAEHKKGRRFLVATTNQDAGRRVLWNMGAIATRGDDKALKLFRDVLLASSSIPGMFQPVMIEVEANGKRFQEMHLDGTITAPFFIMPESMLAAGSAARLPTNQVYVIINSKLESEFSMPERRISLILGRTIGVALTAALKAELLLVTASAHRLGLNLNIAYVPETFNHPNRGLFDHVYMEALFKYGVEQAQKGTGFASTAEALQRRSESAR